MTARYAMSIILEAHIPYVKEYNKEDELMQQSFISGEEGCFFETISETLLPLLEVLERLENDHIPFRLALVMSPVLCHMLFDENMQNKYLAYIDKQIEFGKQEMERLATRPELYKLAELYYTKIIDRRFAYTEKYEKDLLNAIDFYRRRGKLEILATSATHTFLPFIENNPESIQAQIETPIPLYRKHFGSSPQGFWLGNLGWTPAIEPYLSAYNYSYTIVDTHGLLFGSPAPEKGSFYPARTPAGTFILGRDFYTVREIEKISQDEVFRNNNLDAGYELEPELIKPFLSPEGERHKTGYMYNAKKPDTIYAPKAADDKINIVVRQFLEQTTSRLEEASKHMSETPLCVYANNADYFGRLWYEGMQFIEALFRMGSNYRELQFVNPGEYIFKKEISSMQIIKPEFSSSGINGYAESWINLTNDYLFRHLIRSMERMTELADRFPDDTGIKERALNQAAREILLAQSQDALTSFSRDQTEEALRNFTTIYEALGSNYISTEWLTNLEKKHNLFPNINYRVFRRKK